MFVLVVNLWSFEPPVGGTLSKVRESKKESIVFFYAGVIDIS